MNIVKTNKLSKTEWMLLSGLKPGERNASWPVLWQAMTSQPLAPKRKSTKIYIATRLWPSRHQPRGIRSFDEDILEWVAAVPYSPFFKNDQELILGDLAEAGGLLSRFDQSFLNMNKTFISFLEDYKQQSDKASIAIISLWFRMESMSRLLGSRPEVLHSHSVPDPIGLGLHHRTS
jgi:hypothetical protein